MGTGYQLQLTGISYNMPAYKVSNGMKKMATSPPWTGFQHALVVVMPLTAAMILISWAGIFSTATVELGLGHYAEKPPSWSPSFLPMPLNTVINVAYIVCGLYWILFVAEANRSGIVKCGDAIYFFTFNIFGCVYGLVQMYRILFQTHASAVLDQWYTFPLFMMVYIWAQAYLGKNSQHSLYGLLLVSVGSYLLTLISSVGFEISLGCHIVSAMLGGVLLYRSYPSEDALQYFVLALLSCTGFVVLKLLDHYLASVHWIFTCVSGHFLSKICDVLQIHYVNEFFFDMVINKAMGPPTTVEKSKVN